MVGKRIMLKMRQMEDEKDKLNQRLKNMRKAIVVEKKQVAVQMEGQLREYYKSVLDGFVQSAKREIMMTFEQASSLRIDLIQRDKILNKLSQIICAQEQYIEEVRNKIYNKDYQSLELFVFVNTVQGGGIVPHSIVQNFRTEGD